ncbi:Rxlr-like protein [Globisporangium polare]
MSLPCTERNAAVRPDKLEPPLKSSGATRKVSCASPSPLEVGRQWQNKLYAFFVLIVLSCAFGLISVASLIQRHDPNAALALAQEAHASIDNTHEFNKLADANNNHLRRNNDDTQTLLSNNNNNKQDTTAAPPVDANANAVVTQAPTPVPQVKLSVAERWRILGEDLSKYECVAWRRTAECSPDGAVEPQEARTCADDIPDGISGYCEIRHKDTGAIERVLQMHCDSLRPGVRFKCADFREMLEYGHKAPSYVHDPAFSYAKCQEELVNDQALTGVMSDTQQTVQAAQDVQLARGIALVVYEKLFESVFASIKSLRAMGCTLPVELWYIASETNVQHPILQALTRDYGAFLREIKDPRATKFYTKMYAVFYSAFDQVLLLDSDNFAVKDPTFLFETSEFKTTGAMFWPDFWRAKKTIFNIQPRSFVWDVFDLDYVDMFEQESGQVMIDRRRHLPAMNAMMYYAVHPHLVENLRLVWGDKDLFRFAWMKTNSTFHMISMPPGAAGRKLPDKNVFCGVTMVQHDTNNEIMFLHRNQEKLSSENHRVVWEHVQDFKIDSMSVDEYDVRGANGGRYYPDYKRCYGKDIYYEKLFNVEPVEKMPFAGLESKLLGYAGEAAELTKAWKAAADATATAAPAN